MNTTRLQFARAILNQGLMQPGPQYEECLVAIMTGEDSKAHWNGLDTTLGEPGATPYNSFGPNGSYHVWNYPDAKTGIKATLSTMNQPNMAAWTSMMRKPGHTAAQLARAFSLTPWGGIGDVLPLEIVNEYVAGHRDYVHDRQLTVYGMGDWPYDVHGSLIKTK